MKASVQYNDFKGTAAADISDAISVNFGGDNLESFANFFKLDKEKFKIIGIVRKDHHYWNCKKTGGNLFS